MNACRVLLAQETTSWISQASLKIGTRGGVATIELFERCYCPNMDKDQIKPYIFAVLFGSGGGLGVNAIFEHRPDPFTGTEAYKMCKQIEANMPPYAFRRRFRAMEEHLRETSGYVPPEPAHLAPVDFCATTRIHTHPRP